MSIDEQAGVHIGGVREDREGRGKSLEETSITIQMHRDRGLGVEEKEKGRLKIV